MKRSDKLKLIGEAVMLHLIDDSSSAEDEYENAPHLSNDLDVSQLDEVDSDGETLKSLLQGTKVDVFKRAYKIGQLKRKLSDKDIKSDKSTKDLIKFMDEMKK